MGGVVETNMRTCRVEGCLNRHKRSMLMCRRHWLGLPKLLRDELWRSVHQDGFVSEEYEEAAAACFAHWSST